MSPAEDRLREVPWRALRRVAASLDEPLSEILGGASAERVLDRTLRRLAPLDRDERAAVAEALFGVAVWRLRLAHHLGGRTEWPFVLRAGPEGSEVEARPGASTLPRHLLAILVRDLGGEAAAEQVVGLAAGSLPPPRAPPEDLAARYSLPAWLARVVVEEAGDGAAALADALNRPGPVCLRPNGLRTAGAELALRLSREGIATRPGRLVGEALVVTTPRPNLHGLGAWREALFEVQDEASQLAGATVGARSGESVLDLCAGAGGKSLQLACAVGPAGVVHVADPDEERLARLRRRAARAGAAGIVRCHGATAPPDLRVHRVLVDAPCSELGALRRGPDRRFQLDPASFPALESLQRELLLRGASHLASRGRLVYATCTFRTAENEVVAEALERAHPELRRAAWVRTWPHRDECDGFFVAAWDRVT